MQRLNFSPYSFRFKSSENNTLIFDPVRKKFVVLTPEEWVRQHVLAFLTEEKKIPLALISVEKEIKVHRTRKRYDIIVFRSDGQLALIVECKAPSIAISQETFDQIARYNLALDASYLMVTNGLNHYYCTQNHEAKTYEFLREIPSYPLL
ncbi:MAG: type I restriction enzyme HsdR N-terminal domain-containing protein [Gilvibacter sp.]